MFIATCADYKYYTVLLSLLATIKETNPKAKVGVWDIGFQEVQKEIIKKLPNVEYFVPEKINPMMLTEIPHSPGINKMVIGSYSFKPVIWHEAVKKYGVAIYMDAGVRVLRDLTPIENHIKEHGYWFIRASPIWWESTKTLIKHFKITDEEMKMDGLHAGIAGIGPGIQKLIDDAREAAKDINLFNNDGSALGGNNAGRHDQAVIAILMARMKLTTRIGGNPFHVTDVKSDITPNTFIYHSRGDSLSVAKSMKILGI
jgi:hypothetical protein